MKITLNETVLEIIKANPGIAAKKVAEELEGIGGDKTTSKCPAASCSSSLWALYKQGRVDRIKEGRQFRYWPAAQKPPASVANPGIGGCGSDAKQLQTLKSSVIELERRVQLLEAGLEAAFSPPTDPAVKQARRKMAQLMDDVNQSNVALEYTRGLRDDEPVMQALIKDFRDRAER